MSFPVNQPPYLIATVVSLASEKVKLRPRGANWAEILAIVFGAREFPFPMTNLWRVVWGFLIKDEAGGECGNGVEWND